MTDRLSAAPVGSRVGPSAALPPPTAALLAQVDRLAERYRTEPTPALAADLLAARAEAGEALHGLRTRRTVAQRTFACPAGLPELDGADLDGESIAAAMADPGVLVVRGVLSRDHVAVLKADADRLAAPLDPSDQRPARPRVAARHPEVLGDILGVWRDAGLVAAVAEYLGGPPVTLANRTQVRRATTRSGLPWHQDGAFFGAPCGAVNIWTHLSPAGPEEGGLALVPRKVDHLVGDLDAHRNEAGGLSYGYAEHVFDHDCVRALCGGEDPVVPVMAPGDVLLFDELAVHRTSAPRGAARTRDVVTTWLFSPDQVPIRRPGPDQPMRAHLFRPLAA